MADIAWMAPGTRSGVVLIDNPSTPAAETSAARARLDAALGAVENPEGPAWYRPIARLGRWWYLVCAGAGALLLQLTPMPWYQALWIGLFLGPVVGVLTGAALGGIARASSVTKDVRSAATVARRQEYPYVRTVLPGTVESVREILAHSPDRADEVHRLAWPVAVAAPEDPIDEAAAEALDRLWQSTAGATTAGDETTR
jgi:hypothetical protein